MNFNIKTFLLITNFVVPVLSHAQLPIDRYNSYLKTNEQVVFVTAADWKTTKGTMLLYERKNKNSGWKIINQFPVTLGRNGLGVDRRSILPKSAAAIMKHEGDGKSPAGIFSLGPVFSYHALADLKMSFEQVDTTDICVDDVHSAYYNKLVHTDTATHKDWKSFEYMQTGDDSYEYGVWVKYNSDKIFSGDGSCIFLHVWSGESSSTAGCTAMEKQNIIKLIHWLDDRKSPVLLQVVIKD